MTFHYSNLTKSSKSPASIAKSNKQWVILNFTDGEQQICISGGMQSLSDRSLWQITEVHRRMLHIFLKFA